MAILIAIAAFPQSALFTVEQIAVSGTFRLQPATVIALAGLTRGERLFAVDAGAALRRLLADARIKAAHVEIRPPQTVLVRIVERVPVVALAAGVGFALLGDDLVVVAVGPDAAGLPHVVDRVRTVPWARPGAPVASEAARTAVAALPAVPPELRADLQRIVVAAGQDLTFVLRGGIEVRAGGPAGLADRLAQVPRVLEALRARNVTASAIDLRYAGSIAVTLATEGEGR
jgi:cell division protein FtsQ